MTHSPDTIGFFITLTACILIIILGPLLIEWHANKNTSPQENDTNNDTNTYHPYNDRYKLNICIGILVLQLLLLGAVFLYPQVPVFADVRTSEDIKIDYYTNISSLLLTSAAVIITTFGVIAGFLAIWGYANIKKEAVNTAENTAKTTAQKTTESIIESIIEENKKSIKEQTDLLIKKHENAQKEFDDLRKNMESHLETLKRDQTLNTAEILLKILQAISENDENQTNEPNLNKTVTKKCYNEESDKSDTKIDIITLLIDKIKAYIKNLEVEENRKANEEFDIDSSEKAKED